MQKLILNSGLKEYILNIRNAYIKVYSSDVATPIIMYNGSFNIKDKDSVLKINQNFKQSKKRFSLKNFNKKVITINGCKIIKKGTNVIVSGNNCNVSQINGRTFINGMEITDEMFYDSNNCDKNEEFIGDPCIDLILPLSCNDISLNLYLTSGNILLKNLILNRLVINKLNGNINLEDVDAVMTKISSISGNIKAEMAESMLNYALSLNTLNSSLIQRNIESNEVISNILKSKHILNIKSLNDNIKVIFNGKNKKR